MKRAHYFFRPDAQRHGQHAATEPALTILAPSLALALALTLILALALTSLVSCAAQRPPVEQRSLGQRNSVERASSTPAQRPEVEQRSLGQRQRPEWATPASAQPSAQTQPPAQAQPLTQPQFPLQAQPPASRPGSSRGDSVVAKARSVIGTPYRYGGSSPVTGFDCSGLVVWVYATHGVNLPRTAKEQASAGRAIAHSDKQPGDLLILELRRGQSSLHTAIYAGGDTFIHSPSTGARVREESLKEPYWAMRLHSVRRVLD